MNSHGNKHSSTPRSYFRSLLFSLVLMSTIVLSGCSGVVGTLTSAAIGGAIPDVAAQVGKNNTNTIGTTSFSENRIVRPQAREITQDNSETTNSYSNISPSFLAALIVLAVLFGSLVDDVIRAAWSRLWRRK